MEEYSVNEVMNSYMTGNFSHVKQQIDDREITLFELFEYYVDYHNPSQHNLKLFIRRLSE